MNKLNKPEPADAEPSPFADSKKGPNIPRAKKLVEKFGPPHFLNKTGDVSKLNEPFWAAYLQSQHEHLLFEPHEERFYSYDGKTGLFLIRSVDSLRKELAALILNASRAWEAEQMAELAKFRSEAVLRGVLTHLRGQTDRRGRV